MATDSYLLKCLGRAAELKAQDLFFKSGQIPRARVGMDVSPIEVEATDESHLLAIFKSITSSKRIFHSLFLSLIFVFVEMLFISAGNFRL